MRTQEANPLATVGVGAGIGAVVVGSTILSTALRMHAIMAALVAAGALGAGLGTGATIGVMVAGAVVALPIIAVGALLLLGCTGGSHTFAKVVLVLILAIAVIALLSSVCTNVGLLAAFGIGKLAGAAPTFFVVLKNVYLVSKIVILPAGITMFAAAGGLASSAKD